MYAHYIYIFHLHTHRSLSALGTSAGSILRKQPASKQADNGLIIFTYKLMHFHKKSYYFYI